MTKRFSISLCFLVMIAAGCDSGRVSQLEKENQELKAKLEKNDLAVEYDLQAKCSKDARAWFNSNWSRDKNTRLLDFTNHYSKSSNKCFEVVEYHYGDGSDIGWVNDMSLWDVYENSQYGHFAEEHSVDLIGKSEPHDHVVDCVLYGSKCASLDEFNKLARPYMNN